MKTENDLILEAYKKTVIKEEIEGSSSEGGGSLLETIDLLISKYPKEAGMLNNLKSRIDEIKTEVGSCIAGDSDLDECIYKVKDFLG